MGINKSKIHLIVNCANRKRKPPAFELGSFKQSNLEKRVDSWWKNLISFSLDSSNKNTLFHDDANKLRAIDLYIGSYWSNVRQLLAETRNSGFETKLWIISAGYGLISAEEEIYSYSATFSQGDKNSIENDKNHYLTRSETLSNWWELISNCALPNSTHPRKLINLIGENPNDYFLVITSADYLSAIKKDLLDGIKLLTSADNLLIITSKSFSDDKLIQSVIPVDARLQCNGECNGDCKKHLVPKGIRGAISAALAIKVVEKAKADGFVASKLKQFVEICLEESPTLTKINRNKLKDLEVNRFISEELNKAPSTSCSSLLRKLRDNNWACEQKRFKDLYWTIKRNKS